MGDATEVSCYWSDDVQRRTPEVKLIESWVKTFFQKRGLGENPKKRIIKFIKIYSLSKTSLKLVKDLIS